LDHSRKEEGSNNKRDSQGYENIPKTSPAIWKQHLDTGIEPVIGKDIGRPKSSTIQRKLRLMSWLLLATDLEPLPARSAKKDASKSNPQIGKVESFPNTFLELKTCIDHFCPGGIFINLSDEA
jgi:hypothetical protein